MAGLNTCSLIGNLTRDPEKRITPNNKTVVSFGIAVNRQYKNPKGETVKEVSFFDITVFGNQAESCATYLTKGRPVGITGELRQNRWTTPEGAKRSRVGIVANRVQFLGAPPNTEAPEKEDVEDTDEDSIPM